MRLRLWATYTTYTTTNTTTSAQWIRNTNTKYRILFILPLLFFPFGLLLFFNWVLSCISPAPHWHQSFFAIVFLIFYASTCAHGHHHTQPQRQRQRQTKDQSNSCGSVTFDYAKYIRQSVGSQYNNLRLWPQLASSVTHLTLSLCTACPFLSPPLVLAGAWLALTTANFHNCGTIWTQNWPNYVKFV